MLKSLYHGFVPDLQTRETIWFARRAILSRSRRERRGWSAQFWASLGKPQKLVRTGSRRLLVDLRDLVVAKELWSSGEWEPSETAFFERVLRPGMTFVDAGANLGYFTTLASGLVGSSGLVLAIEPEPLNFALLEKNIALNRCTNVRSINAALGDSAGTARLHLSPTNFGDHRLASESVSRDAVEVRVDRLDSVLESMAVGSVDCMKIDVQGYEMHVLDGMPRLLAAGIQYLVMEYWPQGLRNAGSNGDDLLRALQTHGYTASILLEGGVLQPISYDGIGSLASLQAGDDAFVNLVFSRADKASS